MRISSEQKTELLQVAKKVYLSYLALDYFKNIECVVIPETNRSLTLFDFIKITLPNCVFSMSVQTIPVRIADTMYCLEIRKAPDSDDDYLVNLHSNEEISPLTIQAPSAYSEEEVGHLFANKTFIIEACPDAMVVSLSLTPEHTIGGAKKLDLYRTHLVTLFNIIQKIENEEDLSSLLVALATGSGKTFVQALWLAILSLSDVNGVFAIPDKLIKQFHEDLSRLLPDSLINQILIIRDSDPEEKILSILEQLQAPGRIVIASSKLLLDHYYERLMMCSPDHTHFIFDEQHLLMAMERRRGRLLVLAQRYLSVFLTATPDPETYQISGKKPVAIMSNGQKQKAGQGQFPHIVTLRCELISDLHRNKSVNYSLSNLIQKAAESLILSFDHAVQPECSSAILNVFNKLPFVLKRKDNEQNLRWRLQVPMASKILCIVDDNETLVNCCHYLQSTLHNENVGNIYHNGNFLGQGSVSEAFDIPNVGLTVLSEHQMQLEQDYLGQLTPEERAILEPVLKKGVREQLKSNMFHYLVEYVLSDISGRSMIEHNQLRKQSEEAFKQVIVRRYELKDQSYFFNKLCTKIDSDGAQIIAPLLAAISSQLNTVIKRDRQISLLAFTNNWFLDDTALTSMPAPFSQNFENYANQYLIMGVMTGMAESDTAVEDAQPFLGLHEERYSLYDSEGMQNSRAKRRQRTSIELLNDRSKESSFHPNYKQGITKDIADNYLRLGLVGFFVSNMHTEGYSDSNLHTIINVTEHTHDSNNDPINHIQGLGRPRGQDDTAWSTYIHSLGSDASSGFDLQLLTKDDYYPELFEAQDVFKQSYIAILGEQLGKDIITWYHQHQEGDESIDPDLLKRKVLQLVARALRRLNTQENYQIHLSRAQLTQTIAYAMKKLDKEIALTRHPYQLSLFIRVVGSLVNFVCECYFALLRFKPWLAMLWQAWTSDSRQDSPADNVYLKIIRQAHFKDLIAQGLVAAEFKAWTFRKKNALKVTVEKSALFYFKPEIKTKVDAILNRSVIALFEKMIVPEHKAMVRDKLQNFAGLLYLLKENESLLKRLQEEMSDALFANLILPLFHQVPGLEVLTIADVVNYPRQLNETKAWFQQPSAEKLATEPALNAQISLLISEFIQYELPRFLGGFVSYPDKLKIVAALQSKPELIPVFSDYCIAQYIANPHLSEDPSALLAQFKIMFEIPDVVLLPENSAQTKLALESYQLDSISQIIQRELLPTMVNLYPLSARESLLAQLTQDNIVHLLKTQQEALETVITTNDAAAIASFFFTSLCANVPDQINLEQEKKRSASYFIQQTQGWSGATNKVAYAASYVAKSFMGTDFGLLSSRVQTLLKSQGFLDSISLLLPYHHWLELKQRFQKDPAQLKILADALIPYIDKPDKLTADLLLQAINTAFGANYRSTQDYGASIGAVLSNLGAGKQMLCTTAAQQQRLLSIIHEQCLPLLAAYLCTDELKAQFLQWNWEPQDLCDLFISRFAALQHIAELSPSAQSDFVHELIAQLCPGFIERTDLIDPKQFGKEQATHCKTFLQHRVKKAFLMSETCKNKLPVFFSEADEQIVQAILNDEEQVDSLANILPDTISEWDPESLLGHIRTDLPALNEAYFLNERLQQFITEIKDARDLEERALDSEKLVDIAMVLMRPILVHPQFISLIDFGIGSLTEQDLDIIFSARNYPPGVGHSLLRFRELIKKRDFVAFKKEFMQCPPDQDYQYEESPLKLVMDHFTVLIDEVMKCHCYYQQHTPKGIQTAYTPRPAFFTSVSESVQDIRIPIFDNEISRFARRIFFIQGVRNGLPLAGQVFSDSNTETFNALQNIKHNLLTPLWWSVNVSDFMFDWMIRLQSACLQMTHTLQALQIWILGDYENEQASLDEKADIEIDFNISAFRAAKTIN